MACCSATSVEVVEDDGVFSLIRAGA
jgi:hypothetical protein